MSIIIKSSVNKKVFFLINLIFNLLLIFSIEPGRSISSWGVSIWFILFFIQFVWFGFLITKKSHLFLHIFFYNLYFILVLNFLLTPLFNSKKDYPSLSKNIFYQFKIEDKEMLGFDNSITTLTTDEKGFRTNKKINYEFKDSNTLRIVTIGGSQVEEIYIDDKKTWSNLLAEQIELNFTRKIEVINTGISGSGVKEHIKTMEHLISLKNVDHFIFLFGVNDWNKYLFIENLNFANRFFYNFSFKDSLLMRLFTFLNFEIYPRNNLDIKIINKSYGKSQNNSLSNRQIIKNKLIKIPEDYITNVSKIFELCRINNIKCTFVESFNAYDKNVDESLKNFFWMTPPNTKYSISLDDLIFISNLFNNWLKDQVDKNKFNFCNIKKNIEPSSKYFYDDVHLNLNGSKQISRLIFNCIKNDLM